MRCKSLVTLGQLGLALVALSCGPATSEEVTPADSSADDGIVIDAGDAADAADAADAPDPFAPGRFLAAADCPDCLVLHSAQLSLPETGVVAASAKLFGPDGSVRVVSLDASGRVVQEKALLAAERAATWARYGKLRKDLHARLTRQALLETSADARIWTWIRVRQDVEFGPRELAGTPSGIALEKAAVDAVAKSVAGIEAWLAANAPEASRGDHGGPIVRAELTAREIQALAKLDEVVELGTDAYPGTPQSAPWASASQWGATIRLSEAAALSTGANARVCIKEDTRPDVTTSLLVSGTASPSGPTSLHARVMTGIVRNTATAPYLSVAPSALTFVANWSGYGGSVDAWCQSQTARTLSYSYEVNGTSTGAFAAIDMQHDWLAKASPYTLVVSSIGNVECVGSTCYPDAYAANRGMSGLVVGGIDDRNTADRTDDRWSTSAIYRNPATSHNDYELPHVAAPSAASAAGGEVTGTSAATAMVAGVAALVEARGTDLATWPEGKRAVVIATATGRADQGLITSIGGVDRKIGAGEVDAYQAADLASPSNQAAIGGNVMLEKGRLGRSVAFASDFGADGYLTAKWKAHAYANGRLRVVIAWDSTTNCPGAGGGCTTDVQDADFDLHLFKKTDATWTATGTLSCTSATWDSTWEMCDIPVLAGEEYLIAIPKYATSGASTSLGVAWYQYQQPSGAPCASGTECGSGSCSAGKCGCWADWQCPDRQCDATGQCADRQANGATCTRTAQCLSGNCVDGVCCNEACGGTCRACTFAKTGNTADGTCAAIEDGRNPDNECGGETCSGGTRYLAGVCNGGGACRSGGTQTCGGFTCNVIEECDWDGNCWTYSTGCNTTCASNAGCVSGYRCASGACVLIKANGTTCAAGVECASGLCVDGVCCNAGCTGQCEACDVAGAVGTCSAVLGAPHGARTACGGTGACQASCDGANRVSCGAYPGASTVCAAGTCTAGSGTPARTCNGAGVCSTATASSCAPYVCDTSACKTSCATDADCVAGSYCSGTACVAKKANGVTCGGANQCTSGACVDGVCCNSACGGTCQACDVAGSVGTCTTTTGAPHGARPACSGFGTTCGSQCNGVDATQCTYASASTVCAAATACNATSTCSGGGACSLGAAVPVTDSDDCTVDGCVLPTGPYHTPITTGLCANRYAPTWPAGSTLTVAALTTTSARLTWTAAVHPNAVTGYYVYRDGAVVAAVAGTTLTWDAPGLANTTSYVFRVEAYASESPATTNGPQASYRGCGDGVITAPEACDDGMFGSPARRTCTDTCTLTDVLVAPVLPRPSPSPDLHLTPYSRTLGIGRHPIAVGNAGFAVAYVQEDTSPPSVRLTPYSLAGVGSDAAIDLGVDPTKTSTVVLDANPVVAAVPSGRYVAAWTDFNGDGDELGIAMRLVDPAVTPSTKPVYANQNTLFGQRDPDVVWTGSQLVVAWVDDSNPAQGADVKYRTFDAALTPTSGELAIAETSEAESDVALTPFAGSFAAAYRVAGIGGESIAVKVGSSVWTVPIDYAGGPAGEKPAIAALDATHLIVVFSVQRDWMVGVTAGYTLQAAVVDIATAPGVIAAMAVPAVGEGSARGPSVVAVGGEVEIAWRTDGGVSSAYGEELVAIVTTWGVGGGIVLDGPAWGVPRVDSHRLGDQRGVALAVGSGVVVTGWDDLGALLGGEAKGGVDVVVGVRAGTIGAGE